MQDVVTVLSGLLSAALRRTSRGILRIAVIFCHGRRPTVMLTRMNFVFEKFVPTDRKVPTLANVNVEGALFPSCLLFLSSATYSTLHDDGLFARGQITDHPCPSSTHELLQDFDRHIENLRTQLQFLNEGLDATDHNAPDWLATDLISLRNKSGRLQDDMKRFRDQLQSEGLAVKKVCWPRGAALG